MPRLAAPVRILSPLALGVLVACSAHAASTGTNVLLRVTGNQGGTAFGDFVSDANALDTTYRFFVEVPPGTAQLAIDLFDADVGAGGAAEDAANRDRLRGTFDTTTAFRLFQPDGTAVTTGSTPPLQFSSSTATTPAGADNAWLNLYTRANPPAGHWRVEVDTSTTTGDDVNAFGLRAHDGNIGAGGTELNVYADNLVQIGINPVPGDGSRSTVFTLHPYATHGCAVEANDFDADDGSALTVGGEVQRTSFANRDGGFTTNFTGLSGNNAWASDAMAEGAFGVESPSGTAVNRDGNGIWTLGWRINEVAGDNANFVTLYVGEAASTPAPPPTANPQAGAFRLYLPTDGGAAPAKPWLAQRYFYGGSGPNPPTDGQATRLDVVIEVANPGAQAITFSAANTVSSRVGGTTNAGAVYVGASAVASQGTIVSQPGNNAAGLVVWNPGSVAAGATARLTYSITVTPSGGGNATVRRINGEGNGTGNDNTHGTRARFVDGTGNAAQAQATYTIDGLCGLYFRTGTSITTPVTLSYLSARRGADGRIALEWRTDSEFRHAGFHVLGRAAGGAWRRLTTTPVAGTGDTLEPRDYALVVAAPADVDTIALEDLAADGTRTRHPPIALGSTWGRRVDAPRIDWRAVRAAQQVPARRGGAAEGVWIEVARDGIHRLSLDALAAAGQELRGTPAASLALVGPDGALPIHVQAAGPLLAPGDAIEFVGFARRSLYGGTNRYRLLSDPASARRLQPATATRATRERSAYWHDVVVARDRQYSFAVPADDPWYDTRMLAFPGSPAEATFDLAVDRLAVATGATVAVRVSGGNDFPQTSPDHRFAVEVNGTPVGEHAFDGLAEAQVRFELPPGVLREGANSVRLRLPAAHGVDFDIVQVESVSIRHLRRLELGAALVAPLGDAGDTEPASALLLRDGFDAPDPGCGGDGCAELRIGAAEPLVAIVLGPEGGRRLAAAPSAGVVAMALPGTAGATLHATPAATLPSPALVAAVAPAALPQAPLDFIVIAHPQFLDAVRPLVDARRAEGLATALVDLEAVYARHSSGLPDPAAIRAHLSAAHAAGARYALLVGADTYDYKDHLGSGAASFLPTPYAATGEVVRHAPADPLLGDGDGDGVPEVAVGRWPVRTAAEATLLVDKTLAYATGPHAARALFVAGGSEPALDFAALSASLAGGLPPGWTSGQATVDALGAAGARGALAAAVNEGRALVNFVGHSAVDRWTFDPLLTGNDATALFANANAPTVVSQWGCWSSWFVSPTSQSIAQRMLLDADGGAAAVVGAATLVETAGTENHLAAFLREAGQGQRIGDALQAMRRGVAADGAGRRDLTIGIHLLGDPTLRLRR